MLRQLRRCVGRAIIAVRSVPSSHSPTWAGPRGMV